MNLIKYLRVRNFIKKIDKGITVRPSKCLECEPENAKVYIGFKNTEMENRTFRDYVNELNPNCKANDLMLGILHEIGHIYTLDEDDEEGYLQDTSLLQELRAKDLISAEQMNYFYLRLPMESKATKWAIDFAMTHKRLVDRYQRIIGE